MLEYLVIPDSFKGTFTSVEVCEAISDGILRAQSDASVKAFPAADGGEGTVECFLHALNGESVSVKCSGPYSEPLCAEYALINNGRTAVIEIASCAGLPLVENNKNPSRTTTYGMGILMLDALDKGVSEIIIGLGGSCTNDGGAGFLSALGAVFSDSSGAGFIPVGGTLSHVAGADFSKLDQRLCRVKITAMCDVTNPLCGKNGAAYVFAPQKGANADEVKTLDKGLKDFSLVCGKASPLAAAEHPGSGAAGGAGFAVRLLGGELKSGIGTVLDIINFEQHLNNARCVFTGEGKIDSQSASGKVVCGIAHRAKKAGVPVIAIGGCLGEGYEELLNTGVTAVYSASSGIPSGTLCSCEDISRTAEYAVNTLHL